MRRTTNDMERSVARLGRLLAKPRTMNELTSKLGVERTTVYRWFRRLRVTRVGVRRPTKYQIMQ